MRRRTDRHGHAGPPDPRRGRRLGDRHQPPAGHRPQLDADEAHVGGWGRPRSAMSRPLGPLDLAPGRPAGARSRSPARSSPSAAPGLKWSTWNATTVPDSGRGQREPRSAPEDHRVAVEDVVDRHGDGQCMRAEHDATDVAGGQQLQALARGTGPAGHEARSCPPRSAPGAGASRGESPGLPPARRARDQGPGAPGTSGSDRGGRPLGRGSVSGHTGPTGGAAERRRRHTGGGHAP